MEMTRREKGQWLLNEILTAGLNIAFLDNRNEVYVTFECPWGARYKVKNTVERLDLFAKKVRQAYGFGGPSPRGIPLGPIRAKRMSQETFDKKYSTDKEVDYAFNP